MKTLFTCIALLLVLGCQKFIDKRVIRNDQLFGKWILTGGSALDNRQGVVKNQPIYFIFTPPGGIQSNWSNCFSFQFGKANELLVSNGCVDCIRCEPSVWHYDLSQPDKLRLAFGPDDIGVLRRE